mmetsp:Transcript_8469/g.25636  ORF Transcript_8469/g.25636 Transcript_8469/m.25636 type:complete len:209 (-) Transcript_8469:683-1309(-)
MAGPGSVVSYRGQGPHVPTQEQCPRCPNAGTVSAVSQRRHSVRDTPTQAQRPWHPWQARAVASNSMPGGLRRVARQARAPSRPLTRERQRGPRRCRLRLRLNTAGSTGFRSVSSRHRHRLRRGLCRRRLSRSPHQRGPRCSPRRGRLHRSSRRRCWHRHRLVFAVLTATHNVAAIASSRCGHRAWQRPHLAVMQRRQAVAAGLRIARC